MPDDTRRPRLRNSPRFRVTLGLALCVAVVATLRVLALFAINERLETGLLNGIVTHEFDELKAEYPSAGRDALPNSASIVAYVVAPDAIDTLPEPLRRTPRDETGRNLEFNGRIYRVATTTIEGKRAFLAYDITAIESRERLFKIVLIAAAFIVLALEVPLGTWIARISLKPINALAEHVGNLQPGDPAHALAGRFEGEEVGLIARAFDRFMARLEGFVERERSFTADASHELRTPLAVIQGALEVLAQDERLADRAPLTRIERAFERGYRAGPAAGLGLGLYLVKRVADRYGWRVHLDSNGSRGTRIDVHLTRV